MRARKFYFPYSILCVGFLENSAAKLLPWTVYGVCTGSIWEDLLSPHVWLYMSAFLRVLIFNTAIADINPTKKWISDRFAAATFLSSWVWFWEKGPCLKIPKQLPLSFLVKIQFYLISFPRTSGWTLQAESPKKSQYSPLTRGGTFFRKKIIPVVVV